MITATDVLLKRRRNGDSVLRGVSLNLYDGEVVALVGANGVGKTTLLRAIAGFMPINSGTITRRCTQSDIAFLPDKPALYPDWTVEESLSRLASLYCVAKQRIETLIVTFGLESVRCVLTQNLSHGYRQRLSMAQMLLAEPKVILLDEPANGLDYRQRRELWPLLLGLKENAAVMIISHDWLEVSTVADRIYLLKDGVCHELSLPERSSAWRWLEFNEASIAAKCMNAEVIDGRFAAILSGANYDSTQVISVSNVYPAQALQEKIDALA